MKEDNKIWDNYNNLLLSNDISRIRKILARYELFKKTINIPGDIVECGVFKGTSLLRFGMMRKVFGGDHTSRLIAFATVTPSFVT